MTTPVDVRNAEDVNSWIAATVAKWGPLDGAANVAGKSTVIMLLRAENFCVFFFQKKIDK